MTLNNLIFQFPRRMINSIEMAGPHQISVYRQLRVLVVIPESLVHLNMRRRRSTKPTNHCFQTQIINELDKPIFIIFEKKK